MLRGDKIYLRPVRAEDLPVLAARANECSEFNFFGLRQVEQIKTAWQENGMLGSASGTLLIIHDEQIAGDVSYHQQRYGPQSSIAYNIGIELAPEYRGKGYGSEAQRLLAEYLFSVYPIMRVEATTDIGNIPEQRALEKAGFTREGVIRQAQWRTGSWHDMILYSKIRGE